MNQWIELPNNHQKGHLIAFAFGRAKTALENGYFIEAIAICESVIGDRIDSTLRSSSETYVKMTNLKRMIDRLGSEEIPVFDPTLVAESETWRIQRNSAIHGISQLEHFAGVSGPDRLLVAEAYAQIGLKLAERWTKEAKRHKM